MRIPLNGLPIMYCSVASSACDSRASMYKGSGSVAFLRCKHTCRRTIKSSSFLFGIQQSRTKIKVGLCENKYAFLLLNSEKRCPRSVEVLRCVVVGNHKSVTRPCLKRQSSFPICISKKQTTAQRHEKNRRIEWHNLSGYDGHGISRPFITGSSRLTWGFPYL